MPSNHPDLDVRPDELYGVVRAFRGVRDLAFHGGEPGKGVRLEVLVDGAATEEPHWLELLHHTVEILARSAFQRRVEVVITPDDADLDASVDR